MAAPLARGLECVEVDERIDERHMDENNPYDGSGLAPRSCTDPSCLLFFIAFSIGMGCIAVYAFRNGDPRRLTNGYDFKGRLCGVDPGVQDKPLLYWCGAGSLGDDGIPSSLDLQFPTCVDECPSDVFTEVVCLGVEQVQVEDSGKDPFKTIETQVTQSTVKQMSYPTMELGGLYCIPQFSNRRLPGDDKLTRSLMGLDGPLGNPFARCIRAVGGLYRCWPCIACCLPLAALLGYAYLLMLGRNPRFLVQATLLALPAASVALGVFFLLGDALSGSRLASWEMSNMLFHQFDLKMARVISRAVGMAFTLSGLVLLCAVCCLQEAISVAISCIQVACECIFRMPSMLLQPLLELLWKFCVLSFSLSTLIWLLSTAHMENDYISIKGVEVGGLTRTFVFSDQGKAMVVYYLFGLTWLMELTSAVSQFVISYSVILWYYTPKPKGTGPHMPLVRGLIVGAVFHIGTLALGSFLVASLRMVRLLLGLIDSQSRSGQNKLCECVAACLSCCLWCFWRHVEFVNKNAYIDVCISSTGFCEAAQNASALIADEGGKIVALTGACFVFSSAGVLGIAAATGAAAFTAISTNKQWTLQTSPSYVADPFFVAAVAAIVGALVAASFVVVFDHTADTLLYVYSWNRSHGHNTVQKYAPDMLINLTEYRPISRPPAEWTSGGGEELVRPREHGSGVFRAFNNFFANGASAHGANRYGYEEMQSLVH